MKIYLILILCVVYFNLFGLSNDDKYNFGFKAGLNANFLAENIKINGIYTTYDYFKGSFFGGWFVQYDLDFSDFILQFEFNLNQKGLYKEAEITENIICRETQTFYYLEIPLIISYKVTNNLSLYGGGYYAFLLTHNIYIYEVDTKGNIETVEIAGNDYYENFNKNSFGYILGLNYIYKNIIFDLRFNQNLNSFVKTKPVSDNELINNGTWDKNYKIYQLQLSGGLIF